MLEELIGRASSLPASPAARFGASAGARRSLQGLYPRQYRGVDRIERVPPVFVDRLELVEVPLRPRPPWKVLPHEDPLHVPAVDDRLSLGRARVAVEEVVGRLTALAVLVDHGVTSVAARRGNDVDG